MAESQPPCINGAGDTSYDWGDDDPTTGLSFPLYKFEKNKDYACAASNTTC